MITKQTQFAIANYKLGLNMFPESWVVVDNLLGETQHYCVKNHMSCFVDREIVLWHIIQMTVRHICSSQHINQAKTCFCIFVLFRLLFSWESHIKNQLCSTKSCVPLESWKCLRTTFPWTCHPQVVVSLLSSPLIYDIPPCW